MPYSSHPLLISSRIENVTQTVSEHIKDNNGNKDGKAREDHQPWSYGDAENTDYFGYLVTPPTLPMDVNFDLSCSVKLNGEDIPFTYVVGGDTVQGDNGTLTLTANGTNPKWRVLEQYSSLVSTWNLSFLYKLYKRWRLSKLGVKRGCVRSGHSE